MQNIKGVVVGDSNVGKSSFLIAWTTRSFPQDFIPTIYYDCVTSIEVAGTPVGVSVWDTCELEDYDRLRPMSYPQTDVFLLCFSVVKRTSFESIRHKWLPEVRHHCPQIPVVLVGMKSDLRVSDIGEDVSGGGSSKRDAPVTTQEGKLLAREIGAVGYFETSSLYHTGIDETMEAAIRSTLCNTCCHRDTRKKHTIFRWPHKLFFRKTDSIDYHAACNFSDLHQGFAQTMDEESQCEVDGKRESEKKRSDGRDKTMNIFKRLCLFSEVNS